MSDLSGKVSYLGKMVDIKSFRAFVYSFEKNEGEYKLLKKLADSWEEYSELVASGIWFSDIDSAEQALKKSKKRKE